MPSTKVTPRTIARADHIGSLLRPQSLLDLSAEFGAHKPGFSNLQIEFTDDQKAELQAAEEEAIKTAVQRQLDAGLDVVTDGEFSRTLFVNSFYDAIDGLRPADQRKHGRSWNNTRGEEIKYPGPPVIERRLSKVASPAAQEAGFVHSLTDAPVKATFPAGSWFVSPLARHDDTIEGYDSVEELQQHSIDILKELISDAIDAGATHIQLDFPPYVLLIDDNAKANLVAGGLDVEAFMERCLWADRYVLEGLPDHVTYGLHLCRGNNRSSWMFEGPIDPVAEQLFSLPYDRFLIEWDHEERDGGFGALSKVPSGPVVVLGLVDSKRDDMEAAEDLVAKIGQASEFIDLSQLALSPQCGFASSHEGNLLSEASQWRKLELVGEVADRVWSR